jgi:hypothetical protein
MYNERRREQRPEPIPGITDVLIHKRPAFTFFFGGGRASVANKQKSTAEVRGLGAQFLWVYGQSCYLQVLPIIVLVREFNRNRDHPRFRRSKAKFRDHKALPSSTRGAPLVCFLLNAAHLKARSTVFKAPEAVALRAGDSNDFDRCPRQHRTANYLSSTPANLASNSAPRVASFFFNS